MRSWCASSPCGPWRGESFSESAGRRTASQLLKLLGVWVIRISDATHMPWSLAHPQSSMIRSSFVQSQARRMDGVPDAEVDCREWGRHLHMWGTLCRWATCVATRPSAARSHVGCPEAAAFSFLGCVRHRESFHWRNGARAHTFTNCLGRVRILAAGESVGGGKFGKAPFLFGAR